MSTQKPTVKIAIIQAPNHGAIKLLQTLTQSKKERWGAVCETEQRHYELTIGMPPAPEIHGAIVLVDAKEGATMLLRRALWHAKRRGLQEALGLIVCETSDEELRDLAAIDFRESLSRLGFAGDSSPIYEITWGAPEESIQRQKLLEALDNEIHYRELASTPTQAKDEANLLKCIQITCFRKNGTEDIFLRRLWSDLRSGKRDLDDTNDKWRLHSILHQVSSGWFDDIPDLLVLAAKYYDAKQWQYAAVSLDLLGFVGTRELTNYLCTYNTSSSTGVSQGDDICTGMRYWCYLSGAKVLLEEFRSGLYPGDLLFLFPWAIQRILTEEEDGTLESRWERYISEEDMEDYQEAATTIYRERLAKVDEHALLLHGQPFSVRRVAELLLRCRERRGFDGHLAELFTAQTGLPSTPSAVGQLLSRGLADEFEVGRRYFLGHLIPDYSLESYDQIGLLPRYQGEI